MYAFFIKRCRIIAWLNRDIDWRDAFAHGKMERRVNGKWEYRDATESEEWDRSRGDAW